MNMPLSDALRDRLALAAMMQTDGWPVLCAQYERRLNELTDKVLSIKTPASEAEVLRLARAKIAEAFAPKVLLDDLLTKLDAVVKRESPPVSPAPKIP